MRKIWNKIKGYFKKIIKIKKNSIKTIESEQLFTLTEQDIKIDTKKEYLDCSSEKLSYNDFSIYYAKNYSKYFNSAIENPQVRNLAITGEYGVGKSSIFKSFLKNYKSKEGNHKYKDKYVEIEVGEYNKKQQGDSKPENLNNYIQRQIIIQLVSQVNPHEINWSTYKLEKFDNLKTKFYSYSAAILFIFIVIFLYFTSKNTDNFKIWPSWWTIGLAAILFFLTIAFLFLFSKTLVFLIKSVSFSFFSQKIELELSKNGAMSEIDFNISEIVYILKKLNKKNKYIIVFEDLDRFDDVFIFQKLKELNKIINNFLNNTNKKNKNISNNRVLFVYLTKDGLFGDYKNKTKFFDLIIPITPIISESKASKFWNEKFKLIEEQLKQDKIILKRDGDYEKIFKIFAEWVYDFRSIYNILNEYRIFCSFYLKFQNQIVNETKKEIQEENWIKMLSFIVFKNLFYSKYNSFLKDIYDKTGWEKTNNLLRYQNSQEYSKYLDIWDRVNSIQIKGLNNWFELSEKNFFDLLNQNKEKYLINKKNYKKINIYCWLNYILNFNDNYFIKFARQLDYLPNQIKEYQNKFYWKMYDNHYFQNSGLKAHKEMHQNYECSMANNSKDGNINNMKTEKVEIPEYEKFMDQLEQEDFRLTFFDIFNYTSLHPVDDETNHKTNLNLFNDLKNIFEEKYKNLNDALFASVNFTHFKRKNEFFLIEKFMEIELGLIFYKLVNLDFLRELISSDLEINQSSYSRWFLDSLRRLVSPGFYYRKKIFQNIFWVLPPFCQLLIIIWFIEIDDSSNNIKYLKQLIDDNETQMKEYKISYISNIINVFGGLISNKNKESINKFFNDYLISKRI